MRRIPSVLATIATVALAGSLLWTSSAGAVPATEIPIMPGLDSIDWGALTDTAIFGVDPVNTRRADGQYHYDGPLFSRTITTAGGSTTVGRATVVGRASGSSLATNGTELAYLRAVDGHLVVRQANGSESAPSWGGAAAIVESGVQSLSSTWVAAGPTLYSRATGAAVDLTSLATEVPVGTTDLFVADVAVGTDRVLWKVYGSDYTALYTASLSSTSISGPITRLTTASATIGGISDGYLAWSETAQVSGGSTYETTVSWLATGAVTVPALTRVFAGDAFVGEAGSTLVVDQRGTTHQTLTWFDVANPSVDKWTRAVSNTSYVVDTAGPLLALNDKLVTVDGSAITGDATAVVTPPTFAAELANSPFRGPILWLVSEGVAIGYPDGNFYPAASVSRQAMAAFLYRFDGEPKFTPPLISPFKDVKTNHPFYKEITWLVSEGVAAGYLDGNFYPAASVSRQATAAFLYRFAAEPTFTTPTGSPSDVPGSHPFYDEVNWLVDEGIASGYSDKTFLPGAPVSRQAMSTFLFRFDDGLAP